MKYTVMGTAKNGIDYRKLSGRVKIPAGQTTVMIPVKALNDRIKERKETVIVKLLSSNAYAIIGTGRAALIIEDND